MRSCIFYKCLVGDTQFHALSADGEKFPQKERVECIPNLVQAGLPSSKIITIFLKDEPTHMKQEICGRHAVKDMSSY